MHGRAGFSQSFAFVDLYVNGALVQLNLASSPLPCAYEIAIPAQALATNARHYEELTELSFSVHVHQRTVKARNLFLSLRFPWGTTHYLGPLTRQSTVTSARLVNGPPAAVTLIIDADRCIPSELNAPLPCEMLLKEHVKIILENDEFCGSVAAPYVQNLVRDLPFYEQAVRRFRNWSDYVTLFAAFYRCWAIVQYEVDEHAARGLSSLTPPGELRLVATCYLDSYTSADLHRDKIRVHALEEYREVLRRNGEVSCLANSLSRRGEPVVKMPRNMLRNLGNERSFRTLNSVNYLRVLTDLLQTRTVLFSMLHPVQVDAFASVDTSSALLLTQDILQDSTDE